MNNITKDAVEATAKAMLALGRCTCTRCGMNVLNPYGERNAMSRRADVIICDDCGTSEALSDCYGRKDEINEWWIIDVIREINDLLTSNEP